MKMDKISSRLLLFIILFSFPIIVNAQFSDQHKVVIQVLDSLGNPIANTAFEILNLDNTIHTRGSTNSDGLFELGLMKNRSFKIRFTNFDNEHIYNFSVPKETLLKEFRVICRLPVEIAKGSPLLLSQSTTGEEKIIPVTIIIQSKDLKRIPNHSFHLISDDKTINQKCKTDINGSFTIDLLEKHLYTIKTTHHNDEYTDNFRVPAGVRLYTFKLVLPITTHSSDLPTQSSVQKYQRIFTLENVNFEIASFELRKDSYSYLDSLVKELKSKPQMEIEIAGHTDDIGSDEDNLILSQMRAESVYNYLLLNGCEAERITPVGYGENFPITTNRTAEGRAKNRRIEVRVIKE